MSALWFRIDERARNDECENDRQIAEAIGISPSELSKLKNGHRVPGGNVAEKVAAYLDVTVEDVVKLAQPPYGINILVTDEDLDFLSKLAKVAGSPMPLAILVQLLPYRE